MSDKSEELRETQLSDETADEKDFLEEESSVGVTAEGQETERSGEDQAELLRDQLLRTMADFENFKKRKQKEFSDLVQHANERLIVDMLPVLDDFERALKASR
ncbi:MAG: nucleotide exchange factor GrpE, partial [Bacteroidetes bacterium]|nr:nucleotide exchange factor GrpE [Bacteroidota bacterium]